MSKSIVIPNRDVIPVIESDAFAGNESATFAVGLLAVGCEVVTGREPEFDGYLRLRANVYADQTGMISKEHVRADGTESDGDDSRSIHFGVIENRGNDQRVVGAMRLIMKNEVDSRPLPLEEFFDDVFEGNPAPLGSAEVSRYIARHEDQRIQKRMSWPLYSAVLSRIISDEIGPTYATIEPFLERGLKAKGVPFTRLGDGKFVEEYNEHNLPIVIDTATMWHEARTRLNGTADEIANAGKNYSYVDLAGLKSRATTAA